METETGTVLDAVRKAAGTVGTPGLTQSAEPPLWLIDPPGKDGLANAIDPPGAEALPRLADEWDDQ